MVKTIEQIAAEHQVQRLRAEIEGDHGEVSGYVSWTKGNKIMFFALCAPVPTSMDERRLVLEKLAETAAELLSQLNVEEAIQ